MPVGVVGCLWLLAGCDLELVTVADPDDDLVAEIYIAVPDGGAGTIAFVHRTEDPTGAAPLPAIAITLAVARR